MDVKALRAFFESQKIPDSIQLERGSRIIDVELFLQTQFLVLERVGITGAPQHYARLLKLYFILLDKATG
ncbi:DUF6965 family protein [Pedobacter paludis]